MKNTADIDIERTEEGLSLTAENSTDYTEQEIFESLIDSLFWEDMYIDQFSTEWTYITDQNNNNVYMLNDYGYDCLKELKETGRTHVPLSTQTYDEYINID